MVPSFFTSDLFITFPNLTVVNPTLKRSSFCNWAKPKAAFISHAFMFQPGTSFRFFGQGDQSHIRKFPFPKSANFVTFAVRFLWCLLSWSLRHIWHLWTFFDLDCFWNHYRPVAGSETISEVMLMDEKLVNDHSAACLHKFWPPTNSKKLSWPPANPPMHP